MTSICVVTMNRGAKLRQTVETIWRTATEPYELIVVDNGSTEEATLEFLAELDGRAKVIRNATNVGLSKATNQGLAAGSADCLIHMDDDVVLTQPGWNQTLRQFLDAHPEVGIAAPNRGPVGAIRHPGFLEVRWFLGMVWALRRSIFTEIGGYDEQLLHQQECDLCLRVRLHGFYAAYCPALPASAAIHNDDAPQSELAKAREAFGTVQFHDKWTEYFRGRSWSYGTTPRYLMQHFPPDQDFLARIAEAHRLNTHPEAVTIEGQQYWIVRELRPDRAFTEPHGTDKWEAFKTTIVDDWFRLTGQRYVRYRWPRVPYGL